MKNTVPVKKYVIFHKFFVHNILKDYAISPAHKKGSELAVTRTLQARLFRFSPGDPQP
jgi:hypothetical protein